MSIQVFDTLRLFNSQQRAYSEVLLNNYPVYLEEYAIACLYEEETEIHAAIARAYGSKMPVKLSNVLRHCFTNYDLRLKTSQVLSSELKNAANIKATHEFMKQIKLHYGKLEGDKAELGKSLREAQKEAEANYGDFQEEKQKRLALEDRLLKTQEKLGEASAKARKIPRRLKETGDLEETLARLKKKNEQLDELLEKRDNQIRAYKGHRTKDGNVNSCLLAITGIKVNRFNKIGKAIGKERKKLVSEAQIDILKFLARRLGVKSLEEVAFEIAHEAQGSQASSL